MKAEFLVVCEKDLATAAVLVEALSATLRSEYDEITVEELAESVTITLVRPAPIYVNEAYENVERIICGFEIELPKETSLPEETLGEFASTLSDMEGVHHVLKFYDDVLLERNIERMREIFEIEMNLRRILSIIYLSAFADGYYDLLRDDEISIAKQDGNVPSTEHMQKSLENEFFYLLFSQYVRLNKRPNFRIENVITLLATSANFDYIRNELVRLPVQLETDRDFIVSLRDALGPIENLRNCVAHNRHTTERHVKSYETARTNLEARFRDYLREFIPE
jgi:hypothetical protein